MRKEAFVFLLRRERRTCQRGAGCNVKRDRHQPTGWISRRETLIFIKKA
ncbi:hypothetical protein KCP69_26265 [Salmonella enterica subsp. enterica]|nr:hypothetical protein KCP69_26265 [Salmonella enterica subsp. enterica]